MANFDLKAEGQPSVDFKGHICFSFSGNTNSGEGEDTGGGNVQPSKALNFALLVPESTTWIGCEDNRVIIPADKLPNPVGVKANLILDSPFGKTPCITEAWIKNPHSLQWQKCVAQDFDPSTHYSSGLTVNCPGDGKVYISTGSHAMMISRWATCGTVAPMSSVDHKNILSAEVVIGLWCATGDTLADNTAIKALEARVTALELSNA